MRDNASKNPCDFIINPKSEKYAEHIRQFQGCPTIAVTKSGRIFLGWYSGGLREPDMDNYNLLVYSDDNGKTWSEPILVIPSSKELFIHCIDIQLWVSPEDKLYIYWVQNNTEPAENPKPKLLEGQPWVCHEGYQFCDFVHAEWMSVCENPDAEELVFTTPQYVGTGFLRCKPLVLKSGRIISFNYDQIDTRYGYSISDDMCKTFTRHYGAKKIPTPFDETMAYEMRDGKIRMFARTSVGYIAESYSSDGGINWTDAEITDIKNANTRFFVSRTPSGNILLVNNDSSDTRTNMTLYLSDDDGKTWKYKRCIDTRMHLSYPDADFYNGKIYLTYDREREGEAEILFSVFSEDDIMNNGYKFEIQIVSKPKKI